MSEHSYELFGYDFCELTNDGSHGWGKNLLIKKLSKAQKLLDEGKEML